MTDDHKLRCACMCKAILHIHRHQLLFVADLRAPGVRREDEENMVVGVHLPVTILHVITILHVGLILSLVDPIDDVLMAIM